MSTGRWALAFRPFLYGTILTVCAPGDADGPDDRAGVDFGRCAASFGRDIGDMAQCLIEVGETKSGNVATGDAPIDYGVSATGASDLIMG